MSYSSLENNRTNFDLTNRATTFNTFHPPRNNNNNNNNHANGMNHNNGGVHRNGALPHPTENIYDQIPSDQFYDAPYEMRNNDEVYEPEPTPATITINGISVR